jgi:hypothetical protein
MKWATTCTIGSSKYENLKLKKKEEKKRAEGSQIIQEALANHVPGPLGAEHQGIRLWAGPTSMIA